MSFGLASWGLGVWGLDPSVTLEAASAVTTHSLQVTLSNNVRCISPISPGDALRPRTWEVSRDDDSYIWTVIGVLKITDRRFQIFLRQPLQSVNRVHKVRSTTLIGASGIMVSAPYETNFKGVFPSTALTEPTGPSDLLTTDIIGGGLRTTEAGGYARVYGDDLIKKMMFRRLTTMPGSYFHLAAEDFGTGLKIKEPIRTSSLAALQVQIQTDLAKEPGVLAVKVSLSMKSGGLLEIKAKIQTDNGTFDATVAAG